MINRSESQLIARDHNNQSNQEKRMRKSSGQRLSRSSNLKRDNLSQQKEAS